MMDLLLQPILTAIAGASAHIFGDSCNGWSAIERGCALSSTLLLADAIGIAQISFLRVTPVDLLSFSQAHNCGQNSDTKLLRYWTASKKGA